MEEYTENFKVRIKIGFDVSEKTLPLNNSNEKRIKLQYGK